jgi:hemolysin activation/secretion protein
MKKGIKTGLKPEAPIQRKLLALFHLLANLGSYQSFTVKCSLLILHLLSIVTIDCGKATASDGVITLDQKFDLENQLKNKDLIVQTPEPSQVTEPNEPQRMFVRKIQVVDSTVFSEQQLNQVLQPFEGRELTIEEIRKAADAITQLYLNNNYINSRAIPVAQQPGTPDGVVVIRVIEGSVTEIEVQGNQRVNPGYVRSRIQLGAKTPLNTIQLEDQLRLLRLDPLFTNIEASLRPTGQVGQSILIVRVEEANAFISSFNIDNYSPPSIGAERFGVELRHRNVTGNGDELAASWYRSFTGGSNVFDFSYQIPVNAMDGKVRLRFAPNRNEITQEPFDQLGIKANQDVYDISYRQPIMRSPREEFALSFGFTHENGQTFLFDQLPTPFGIGPDVNGVSRTSVFKFSQDYIKRDPQGAWYLQSQFNLGTGLLDATINNNPIPDGRFFSWLGQIQRVQRLSQDHLLLLQAELQLTPDSLLPSQQFIIGGGRSVRGYRQNARSGDNGFRLTIEDRITVQRNEAGLSTIEVIPFFDLGTVWNQSDNPNITPNQTFLTSAGLGLLWNQAFGINRLTLRLDYGIPFVNLSDRGNNAQDDGFYFSVRYQP